MAPSRLDLPQLSMSTWQFQTQQFLLPKSGHRLSECEDAIAINSFTGRFAIADGATEAFDAQSWALRLADDWVRVRQAGLTSEGFRAWVAELGKSLHDSWSGLSLSWYAEEKARTGSFAAFVGVQLDLDIASPGWRAVALGDACLIHCRNRRVLNAVPISNPESFNSTPLLVPSCAFLQGAGLNNLVIDSGVLEHRDVLLLFSDAAAAWYLMLPETDEGIRSRFESLLKAARNDELEQLFESERQAGRIKNDDVAVIRIEVEQQ